MTATADDILRAAPLAYLAVTTTTGPHLTPQLLGVSGDRLWFATAAGALKVRAVRKRPGVAVCAWTPGEEAAAVLHGDAHVLDPTQPVDLVRTWLDSALGPLGIVSFVQQHAAEVTATLANLAKGALGSTATEHRVLVSVHPDTSSVVAVSRDADAVLCWAGDRGPVAVPVEWDESASTASLSPAVRELLDGPAESRVAVTVDRSEGNGAAERAGTMFRGTGRLVGDAVEVGVERVTTWSGDSVETRRASS